MSLWGIRYKMSTELPTAYGGTVKSCVTAVVYPKLVKISENQNLDEMHERHTLELQMEERKKPHILTMEIDL